MTDMIWIFAENIITVFEAFSLIWYICRMTGYDPFLTGHRKKYIAGSLILSFISIFLYELVGYEGIWALIYIAYYFVFSLTVTKKTWSRCLFSSVTAELILICINALATNVSILVLDIVPEEFFSSHSFVKLLYLIIVQAVHIGVFILFIGWFGKSEKKLGAGQWILTVSMLILSFVIIAMIQLAVNNSILSAESKIYLMTAETAVIVMDIVMMMIFDALNKSNAEKAELKLLKEQEKYRIRYAENVREQYHEIRRIRHDMKQSLAVISALCSENKTDKAFEYANGCADKLEKLCRIIDVENDFANAIINSKISLAGERGIKVICHCTTLSFPIDDEDICSLIGNLFDNAIEAAEKCDAEKRYIELSLRCDKDRMTLKISNSIYESVLETGGLSDTSKANKNNHGFGVETIRSIAAKYGGSVHYSENGAYLCCNVVLFSR